MDRTRSSSFLAALFFGLSLSGGALADGYERLPSRGCPAHGQFNLDHSAELSEMSGCGNRSVSDLSTRIVRGGYPKDAGIDCLAKSGVFAVIDLRAEGETKNEGDAVSAAGMDYYRYPMSTSKGADVATNEKNALAAAKLLVQLLQKNTDGKVFIHCTRGEDRTGLVLGLFRLLQQKCSADDARAEMERFYYTPYPALETVWKKYAD